MNKSSNYIQDPIKKLEKRKIFVVFVNILLLFFLVIFFMTPITSYFYYNVEFSWLRQKIFILSIPLFLSFLIIISFNKVLEFRLNLVLFIVSTFIAIYGAHGIFIYWEYLYFSQLSESKQDAKFDTRSKKQVIRDLRGQGIEAYPTLGSTHFALSPLAVGDAKLVPLHGIRNVTTVLCNETGTYAIYKSDEFGYNNPKGIWGGDSVQILAVGDSFTEGSCVPPAKNAMSVVRNKFPSTLNLGRAGDGPLAQLAQLHEFGSLKQPKIVLWMFYEGNDLIRDLWREKRSQQLFKYLSAGRHQQLNERRQEVNSALKIFADRALEEDDGPESDANRPRYLVRAITLSYFRVLLNMDNTQSIKQMRTPDLPLFRQVLFEAKALVNSWGGKLLVVYLPDDRILSKNRGVVDILSQHWTTDHRGDVIEIITSLEIPVIRADRVIESHQNPVSLFPFGSGHFNELGYRIVGETILEGLTKMDVEP
jgi:hypothetical protein